MHHITARLRWCGAAIVAVAGLAVAACGPAPSTGQGASGSLVTAGDVAPITAAGTATVTIHPETTWRLWLPEQAVPAAPSDGARVQLEINATVGVLFNGPGTEELIVITNPADGHHPSAAGDPPAKLRSIVFVGTVVGHAHPAANRSVPAKLGLLDINGSGLYVWDGFASDPACLLLAHTTVAVLARDRQLGLLVEPVAAGWLASSRAGWMPVWPTSTHGYVGITSAATPVPPHRC